MKKGIIFLILCGLILPAICLSAGSVAVTKEKVRTVLGSTEIYTFAWAADSSAATVPDTSTSDEVHGYVVRMATDPGGTAPTANYDISITDVRGVDVLGGEGADRAAATSEQVIPKLGNAYGPCRVDSVLTHVLTNNSVNSATGETVLYIMSD